MLGPEYSESLPCGFPLHPGDERFNIAAGEIIHLPPYKKVMADLNLLDFCNREGRNFDIRADIGQFGHPAVIVSRPYDPNPQLNGRIVYFFPLTSHARTKLEWRTPGHRVEYLPLDRPNTHPDQVEPTPLTEGKVPNLSTVGGRLANGQRGGSHVRISKLCWLPIELVTPYNPYIQGMTRPVDPVRLTSESLEELQRRADALKPTKRIGLQFEPQAQWECICLQQRYAVYLPKNFGLQDPTWNPYPMPITCNGFHTNPLSRGVLHSKVSLAHAGDGDSADGELEPGIHDGREFFDAKMLFNPRDRQYRIVEGLLALKR
ncbi:hypothetical protein K402DRAFT_431071 [Aulographum hederae CBS 113979]|uniref:Uncharacterized protein n=1 Tax=Aulographum hederae CBS 113979 TaxID=1176131 RepID=A0A6G1H0Y4_9PEZI|nr:hypothetical protein K402DRAFT_431071 [Aulographum hederae CBS 113979]